jgi:hypothetical protein
MPFGAVDLKRELNTATAANGRAKSSFRKARWLKGRADSPAIVMVLPLEQQLAGYQPF